MTALTPDDLNLLKEQLEDIDLNRICAVRMAKRDLDNGSLVSCMSRLRSDLDKYYDDPIGGIVRKYFEPVPAVTMPDFDFLVWVRNTFFFKQDAYDLMVDKLDIDPAYAWCLVASDAFKECDIVKLYNDYGIYHKRRAWDALMAHLLSEYNRISRELDKGASE